MNKIHITITAMLAMLLSPAFAQTTSQNYVQTVTMLDESSKSSISAVQYYNGLGYPTVSVGEVGGNGENAYSLTTYDALGREECKYLPVVMNGNLAYKTPAEIMASSKGSKNYNDKTAYSQNHYDALDRITSVELPGKAWRDADKRNRNEYSANTDADKVRIYKANPKGSLSLQNTGKFYTAGSLTKEVVKDADNKTVITFKDLFGNVILQRANDGTNNLDTYYVYDDLGRLCYVLSPQYQKVGTKAINCYEYRYDDRGRIYKKKLPGCEIIQYWYDNADRVVCTQDGYMRKQSPSIARFSIYDSLGRMVIQGLCSKWNSNSTFLRDSCVVAKFDPKSEGFMGTGYILPDRFARTIKTNTILEIVNYYDGNHSKIKGSFKEHFNGVTFSYADVNTQRGQLTGNVTLAGSREAKNKEYLASVMEYDVKGNIIKSKSREIGGRIVTNTNSYTFTNNLESSKYDVDKGNVNLLSVNEILEYNGHNNKKQKSTLTITYGGNKVTSEMGYAYDALGRLDSISRPSSGVKYEYDLHGWLKKIKTNRFVEELFYADWSDPTYNCYNGNIGVIRWSNSIFDLSQTKRGYKYTYDGANRLTDAFYCEYNELRIYTKYNEKMQYDANGNITKIFRQGKTSANSWGTMDDLTITYNGNQLDKVSEAGNDYNATGAWGYKKVKGSQYIYNENGSLVADKSRGIAYITYDPNNNPDSIFFTNGSMTKYVYSASGQKLRVVHYTAKPNMNKAWGVKPKFSMDQIQLKDSTDYLLGGSLVMQNGTIDKFLFEGGYAQVRTAANNFEFYYYNQDHLGNNREVVDANGKIRQTTNYYAFGMISEESSSSIQPYKYNGKELDRMHGLDTYDYGARQYDPVLARWDRIDPHCESYYNVSPYVYANNNPICNIDPDGRDWYSRTDENGAVIYQHFDGSGEIEGWTNIGANHTVTCGNITYNYEQNEMVSMTETVLTPDDWCSQMTLANGKSVKKQPKETEGDCFYQSGNMVKKSGTTSLGGTANNVCKDKEIDNKKMQSYIDEQIDCGYSVRVQVDRKSSRQKFDGNGDHWVAIAARITDMRTGKESFQFFDPGTVHPNNGTSKNNCFKFNPTSNCWTSPAYDSMKYNLINVRKNIKRER